MRRSQLFLSLVLATQLGACKSQSEPAASPVTERAETPEPPPAPLAARASAPSLGFVDHIDATYTSIVYVGDLVPHLSRMLRSETVRELARSNPIFVKSGPGLDPATLHDQLERNERWVPLAVAVATTDATMTSVIRLYDVILLMDLCQTAVDSGEPFLHTRLPELRGLVLEHAEALSVPTVVAWARMRGRDEAADLFTLAGELASSLPAEAKVERDAASIAVELALDDVIDRETLLGLLVNAGAVEAAGDPGAARLADALLGLRVEISLRVVDDAIVLRVRPDGEDVIGDPVAVDALGTLLDPESSDTVAWVRWDVRSLAPVAASMAKRIDGWRETPQGRALLAGDSEDMAGDIQDIHRMLGTTSLEGEIRVAAKDGLTTEILENAPTAAPRLASNPILRMLPADLPVVRVDATENLGDLLAQTVMRGEDRLGTQMLRAQISGDETKIQRYDEMSLAYYGKFAAARELLLRRGPQLFEPPYALLVSELDTSARVEVVGSGTASGMLTYRGLVPAIAVIGRPKDIKAAMAWVDETYAELVRGVYATQDRRPDSHARFVRTIDLGLGVTTRAFDGAWIPDAMTSVAMKSDPRIGVHYFEHEGHLVLSTSPELSRRIVNDDRPRVAPPDPSSVGFATISGPRLAEIVSTLATGFQTDDPSLEIAMNLVGGLFAALGTTTWDTRETPDGRRTTITSTVASP